MNHETKPIEPHESRGDPSADSEHTQKAASLAIRKSYVEKLDSDIEEFADRASLADTMLLHDLLQSWRAVTVPKSERSFLGGAMAELLGQEPDGAPAPVESAPEPELYPLSKYPYREFRA